MTSKDIKRMKSGWKYYNTTKKKNSYPEYKNNNKEIINKEKNEGNISLMGEYLTNRWERTISAKQEMEEIANENIDGFKHIKF